VDIRLATSHLYDSYVTLHRRRLDPLLASIRQRTGECPESWQEVVERGLLPEAPLDYVGNPTSSIRNAAPWWRASGFR